MSRRLVHAVALGAALGVAPLAAQGGPSAASARGRPVLELAPYAGYMLPVDLWSGPVGTRLTVSGGPVLGGQVGIPLLPGVTVVGNVAYATGDLEAGAPILGGVGFGESTTWMYDGGLQLGVPRGREGAVVTPFVQIGAGAVRRDLRAAGVTVRSTDFAWHAGAGLDLTLAPHVGLWLLARDYVGRFGLEDATTLDVDSGVLHNVGLGAGLRLSF